MIQIKLSYANKYLMEDKKMNIHLLIQGLLEIILSLLSGILIYFTSFKAFALATRDIRQNEEIKNNNIAVSILVSSFVFGVMLLIRASIGPSMDTLGFTLSAGNVSLPVLGFAVLRIIIIYLITAISAFIFLWIAIKFFMMLTTQIDEMKEIKNNNIAIAIIIAVLTISLAMIILEPLSTVLKGFVAAPVMTGELNEEMINTRIFYQGLIELGISLISAIFIFLYGFKVYDFMTKDIDEVAELKSNNIAIAIQVSAFIFSMMILIKASLLPAYDTLGYVMDQSFTVGLLVVTIIRIVVYFVLAAILAFILLWLAMKWFMMLNKSINEMEEIKNNNIAVAIIIAILLISTALLLHHGLVAFLSGLVPKPEMSKKFLEISFLNLK